MVGKRKATVEHRNNVEYLFQLVQLGARVGGSIATLLTLATGTAIAVRRTVTASDAIDEQRGHA